MAWTDFRKLFSRAFEPDPLAQERSGEGLTGAGISQPDALTDIRSGTNDGGYWPTNGGSLSLKLRDSNELIDTSATGENRKSRYNEYERLRKTPEIGMAMTVMADETCLAGNTKIATPYDGLVTIKWLAENKKEPFLVYCWDFKTNDYTLGWAYDPRLVKKAKTIKVVLDDGSYFVATPEHRVLMKDGKWKQTGELEHAEELKPFYRIRPDPDMTDNRVNQFPRILTTNDGWKHERQFIDEWRTGQKLPKFERLNRACRMLSAGLTTRKTAQLMKHQWPNIESWIKQEGFSTRELKWLGNREDHRRIIGIYDYEEMDVYDLSVKEHQNFCGESVVFHNCQKDDNGNLFEIVCKNKEIKEELEYVAFNRNLWNLNRKLWNITIHSYIKGDSFLELIMNPEHPEDGILKLAELQPEFMHRIETTRGRLLEFQQSTGGPDYSVISNNNPEAEKASIVTRFDPNQIVHIRIGDDRQNFYPYGQSLIEPARGPAHQLKLMEDAMLVYRLTRAPERRVFYIDVAQLAPYRAEAFLERLKDQFRKKKVPSAGNGGSGVEEKWHAPAADEDYWLPIRPNSNTRIDTLPGAQNLGEIDDALYFRTKLFTALNFPKNYLNSEDMQVTRITLSAQDVKFAKMIERLQSYIEDGLWQIADRHLKLRGYPAKSFADLEIRMTPPSDWREMSKAEVITNRLNMASTLKSAMLLPDDVIQEKWMKLPPEEVKENLAKMKIQKLEEMKLQVLGANPQLMGVGVPGVGEPEIGAEAGGPSPMLGPDDAAAPEGEGAAPEGDEGEAPTSGAAPLPEPDVSDLKKFDLEIQDYGREQDREDIDFSVSG